MIPVVVVSFLLTGIVGYGVAQEPAQEEAGQEE